MPFACLLVALQSGLAEAAKTPVLGPAAAGITVSPQPGTPDASPQTQISILGPQPQQIKRVTVVGANSGRHAGRLRPYSNGQGASFVPRSAFAPGEEVGVSFDVKGAAKTSHIAFHFLVDTPATPSVAFMPPPGENLTLNAQQFVTRPDLHPTNVVVTNRGAGVAPGYVFVAPIRGPGPGGPMFGQFGPMILDGNGSPAWFKPAPAGTEDFNFEQQTYNGAPVLTWWEGQLAPVGVGAGVGVIYDDHYRQLATVKAGNGLTADLHDFIITPQNTALVIAYGTFSKDLSAYGGDHNGTAYENAVQEIDIKTGLVMWEWHHFGHIDPADSESAPQAGQTWDPFHLNSIQQLPNGNIVISDRNTWGVYAINKATGKLIWRLGGKKSTFAMGPGTRFTWQHDARFSPTNNTVQLFDDEAAPPTATQSRGLVLKLDPAARTATVLHEYVHTPPLLTGSQGNMQLLPNGNQLVGWGAQPYFTEFNSAGQIVFDAHFVAPIESYREYRFPWTGRPTTRPTLVAKAGPNGTTLYASWNGDTLTSSWQFLAGSSPSSLTAVGTVARGGFETSDSVTSAGPYFMVRALTPAGRVLAESIAVKPS